MAKRTTTRYTMRGAGNRIVKFGITNDPSRRESENKSAGNGTSMRVEGPKVSRDSALGWERSKIENYQQRNGRRPPGNKV